MSSRYPTINTPFYCYHPRKIVNPRGDEILVPCGKCNGCLLHKANRWSMRLGNDLENNANSIFFTLTYNNRYVPFAVPDVRYTGERFDDGYVHRYRVNHPDNIRFDGVAEKCRKEDFEYLYSDSPVCITNGRVDCVPYLAKRDIQLWLKMLRKSISLQFKDYDINQSIKYFVVGEYGPTRYRPHYHGTIICNSHEVSEYLIESALYQNWKMCDKTLFDKYTHYCDSGARGYVTQYLTGYSNLPKVYQNKEIKPFRLASKAPSTGTSAFDLQKVFQDVFNGNLEYVKSIKRLDAEYILEYPSEVGSTLFPKCYRYSELSYDGLLRVYSRLYLVAERYPEQSRRIGLRALFGRLYPNLHAGDITAAVRCYRFCKEFQISPFVYVFTLRRYYYLKAQRALKLWYQRMDLSSNSFNLLCSYVNFPSFCMGYRAGWMSSAQVKRFSVFLEPFGISLSDITNLTSQQLAEIQKYVPSSDYVNEVDDIVSQMEKLPKYNLLTNQSPHII